MIKQEYTIISKKIKKNIDIAVVADMHNEVHNQVLDLVVNCNFILMPGDFCVRYSAGLRNNVHNFLKSLSTIAPVFCSPGNHDVDQMTRKKFISMISAANAKPLINEYMYFDDIAIGGWYYGLTKHKQMLNQFEKEDSFKLLMSHKPEWYPEYLQARDIDLIVSGHAHGGQMKPFNISLYAPGQGIFPKYTKGIYNNMIVSTGIGNPVKIPRLFNPREVVIIHLQKA